MTHQYFFDWRTIWGKEENLYRCGIPWEKGFLSMFNPAQSLPLQCKYSVTLSLGGIVEIETSILSVYISRDTFPLFLSLFVPLSPPPHYHHDVVENRQDSM